MNIWTLISHLPLLLKVAKDVEEIIQDMVSGKEKYPNIDQLNGLIDCAVDLLNSGLFTLPQGASNQIIAALKNYQDTRKSLGF